MKTIELIKIGKNWVQIPIIGRRLWSERRGSGDVPDGPPSFLIWQRKENKKAAKVNLLKSLLRLSQQQPR